MAAVTGIHPAPRASDRLASSITLIADNPFVLEQISNLAAFSLEFKYMFPKITARFQTRQRRNRSEGESNPDRSG